MINREWQQIIKVAHRTHLNAAGWV